MAKQKQYNLVDFIININEIFLSEMNEKSTGYIQVKKYNIVLIELDMKLTVHANNKYDAVQHALTLYDNNILSFIGEQEDLFDIIYEYIISNDDKKSYPWNTYWAGKNLSELPNISINIDKFVKIFMKIIYKDGSEVFDFYIELNNSDDTSEDSEATIANESDGSESTEYAWSEGSESDGSEGSESDLDESENSGSDLDESEISGSDLDESENSKSDLDESDLDESDLDESDLDESDVEKNSNTTPDFEFKF